MSEDNFLDPYDEPSMDLFIETLTGTTFEMRVYPTDTILDIKKKIQRIEGIPVHHQNLLFKYEEVEDFMRLCDLGVVSGSTLKLVLSVRGGPISTRRLSICDHHLIWKDLKELIEHTREEFSDKLAAGAKVSVLVFKDGDVINLIRVIENDDGSYQPYNDKLSSSPTKLVVREADQVEFYNRLQENNAMLTKLTELRKKMADLSLKRHFKNSKPVDIEKTTSVGCIGEKLSRENEEETETGATNDANFGYHLLDQFRKDAESLLKLHESQFNEEDENEKYKAELDEALQACEDSIALKEKHRGKNSYYDMFRAEKPYKVQKPQYFFEPSTCKESRKPKEVQRNVKVRQKVGNEQDGLPNITRSKSPKEQTTEEKIINSSILSPFYNCFNGTNRSRSHKYDNKINISGLSCEVDISPPTTASSIAESIAIIDEDSEEEEKEVISPIGVPCAGTVSMSQVPTRNNVRLTPLLLQNASELSKSSPETVNIEENTQEICDIFTGESAENFRSNKLGLLKRWQSVDCSSEEVYNSGSSRNAINYKESHESTEFGVVDRNCYLPPLFSTSPGTVSGQFSSQKDRISDLYFGNRMNPEKISRSPLYRRFSQTGNFSSETDNSTKTNDNHKGRLHNLGTNWGPSGSGVDSNDTNLTCDNVLNIQPLAGTLYNFISGKNPVIDSNFMESRVELNPLRFRNEEESKMLADEIKNLYSLSVDSENGSNVNKIQVNTTKLENLPAIIDKKRMRCRQCNKRLNITNMYDCRCGGIFCAQHRYSEVHGCNYDYKSEGRKLLEQQNPVIVADKLNKL